MVWLKTQQDYFPLNSSPAHVHDSLFVKFVMSQVMTHDFEPSMK